MPRTSDARERLLQAAIDLIWAKSYGAVSVEDICQRAGVQKGSFYHFFPSKDDLVIAALERHWRMTAAPLMDRIFSAGTAPLERLQNYLAYIPVRQEELFEKYGRVVGCPFGSLAIEVPADSAIAAAAKAYLRRKCRYLESTIRDLKADGILSEQTDAGALTQSLWTFLEGALAQARISNDLAPTKSLAAASLQFLGIDAQLAASR